jgi:transcription elongation factor Elf1
MSAQEELSACCPECGYELTQFSEAVEALEGGAVCPMCGAALDAEALAAAVDRWDDFAALREGAERAEDAAALGDDEQWLESGPDFGDDGEEDAEEDQ